MLINITLELHFVTCHCSRSLGILWDGLYGQLTRSRCILAGWRNVEEMKQEKRAQGAIFERRQTKKSVNQLPNVFTWRVPDREKVLLPEVVVNLRQVHSLSCLKLLSLHGKHNEPLRGQQFFLVDDRPHVRDPAIETMIKRTSKVERERVRTFVQGEACVPAGKKCTSDPHRLQSIAHRSLLTKRYVQQAALGRTKYINTFRCPQSSAMVPSMCTSTRSHSVHPSDG